jgi:hypothetical protein
MSADRDYYAILGVRADAEGMDIRTAYRSRMRECHPDLNTSTAAAFRARSVNEAYRVLRDRELRAVYDRGRRLGLKKPGSALQFTPPVVNGVAIRHEIDLARPANAGHRQAWFPFTLFVLVVAGSFSALLASGILDATPVRFPEPHPSQGRHEQEWLPFQLEPLIMQHGAAKSPLEQGEVSSFQSPVINDPGDEVQILPAILTSDITDGVGRFAQVSLEAGMSGAQQYSVYCHKQAAFLRSWHRADRCSAFDITAASVDAEVSSSTNSPANRYFYSQVKNPGAAYAVLGLPEVAAELRFSEIRKEILPILLPKKHVAGPTGNVGTAAKVQFHPVT